jgi:hypothetical protein
MILFLTLGAIEHAAIADSEPFDRARTNPAALAGAVIDAQMVLKFAGPIIGVAVV